MRIIKLFILLVIFYGILPKQQLYLSSAQHQAEDPRVAQVERFLASFNSPFTYLAKHFVITADAQGLDYRLLPVVSCVESSCGKNYIYNAFGWGSDSIDYGNDASDIIAIASRINSLSYYQTYKKTQNLYHFALAYNHLYAKDYYKKLIYFMEKIGVKK